MMSNRGSWSKAYRTLFSVIAASVMSVASSPATSVEGDWIAGKVLIRLTSISTCKRCQAYEVTVDTDGNVAYIGMSGVAAYGHRASTVDSSAVLKLLGEMKSAGFFDHPRFVSRGAEMADSPTAEISVITATTYKAVRFHHFGDTPKDLAGLKNSILTLAGAQLWLCATTVPRSPDCRSL